MMLVTSYECLLGKAAGWRKCSEGGGKEGSGVTSTDCDVGGTGDVDCAGGGVPGLLIPRSLRFLHSRFSGHVVDLGRNDLWQVNWSSSSSISSSPSALLYLSGCNTNTNEYQCYYCVITVTVFLGCMTTSLIISCIHAIYIPELWFPPNGACY